MTSNTLADPLASGVALFGQGNRLLRLRFADESGLPKDDLLAQTIKGEEALSRCCRYRLDCLSTDTNLEFKGLLDEKFKLRFPNGKPMASLQVQIKNDNGKTLWSGTTNAEGETDLMTKALPENIKIEFKKS